ncbi:mitochondrial GTPase 1-like isoform X2 [Panicum hallii]|nr:mitochondrial GTPase 1-like isoform X2 [Panicum hallii]
MRGLTRAAKRAGEMAFNAGGGAVNWFPGHRAAASRAIRDRLKLCRPLVIEVRDARIPLSSANEDLQPVLAAKRRILALNKKDLANPNILNMVHSSRVRKSKAVKTFLSSSSTLTKVQSAINEGRLVLPKMQVDKAPLPIHTIDLSNAKVLIRLEQAEWAKGKNVIIGEARLKNSEDKILAREVVLEKTPDGKELQKITVKASKLGGQASSSRASSRPVAQARPVRPVLPTGQAQGRPKMIKPRRPEVGTWKVNESKVQGKFAKHKPTFHQLLNKYMKQKAVPKDRPLKKRPWSPPHQNRPSSPQGESSKRRGDVTTPFPLQK